MDRLKKIASYTEGSQIVCDIGCDHAYALVYSIQDYGVQQGIAADIAIGPLNNARKTIAEFHLENQIKTILSDGFTAINEPFDTAILAGMGGILICDILSQSIQKLKSKRLIIEANSDSYRVRNYLFSQGFIIIEEDAFYDHNQYYEVMVFEEGTVKYTSKDIAYGPILMKHKPEAFLEYYRKKRNLLESVLSQIENEEEKKKKEKQIDEIDQILKV